MMAKLFLIAIIAGTIVAIDSQQVDSVVDIGHITPIPRAEAGIVGLAALRSRVVTVIDASGALGLAPQSGSSNRAVITLVDHHHYAILVDTLLDVAPFEETQLSSGFALGDGWRRASRAIVEHNSSPVLSINLRALIPGVALAA